MAGQREVRGTPQAQHKCECTLWVFACTCAIASCASFFIPACMQPREPIQLPCSRSLQHTPSATPTSP